MKKQFLVDMDGLLTDFLAGAMNMMNIAHGTNFQPAEYAKLWGRFDINEFYGVSEEEFRHVLSYDDKFWEHLKPTAYGLKLYFWLNRIAPVTIVTSPTSCQDAPSQKLRWLQHYLKIKATDVVLCYKKHLLAGNGILIDDLPENVNNFIAAGGEAILVPSEWNTPNVTFKMVVNPIIQNKSIQQWMNK